MLTCAVLQAQSVGPDEIRSRAQPYRPVPALTLRTQVHLVEVPVVIRDRQHAAVAGLTQNDFSLFDNGKKQEISLFTVQTLAPSGAPTAAPATKAGADKAVDTAKAPAKWPRYIVICFDNLSTDAAALMRSKTAAGQFVQKDLAPGDQVAVTTTEGVQSQSFTGDVPTLLSRIERVQVASQLDDGSSTRCPPMKAYEAYLIANSMDGMLLQAKIAEYQICVGRVEHPENTIISMARALWEMARAHSNRTLQALDELVQSLATAPGQHMILLASSGYMANDLQYEEESLIQRALHAGVVINALGARGVYAMIPGGDASTSPTPRPTGSRGTAARITEDRVESTQQFQKDDGLAVLASGTGGTFFHDNNDLLRGFRELGMVPGVIYVLGFSPTDTAADGRFHDLKVKLSASHGYSVQTRMGYNAPSKASLNAVAQPSKLDTEMEAADVRAELPAQIVWQSDPQKGEITYIAHIEIDKLKFQTRQDRRGQELTLVAAIRDASGNLVAAERSDVELNLTDATFTKMVSDGGINLTITLKAPSGTYSVRGLLLDGVEGKLVTSSRQLQLP